MLKKYLEFRKTRKGMVAGLIVASVLAYALGSLAIDSGSLWLYTFTLVLLYEAILNVVNLLGSLRPKPNVKKSSRKTA